MKFILYGCTVERRPQGTTDPYVAVPNVETFAIPEVETEYVEVTDLDSPGGFREYIEGLKDLGETQMVQNYTDVAMVQAVGDNGLIFDWRVTLPNNATLEFAAYRRSNLGSSGQGNKLVINTTLRGTGAPAYTPAP